VRKKISKYVKEHLLYILIRKFFSVYILHIHIHGYIGTLSKFQWGGSGSGQATAQVREGRPSSSTTGGLEFG